MSDLKHTPEFLAFVDLCKTRSAHQAIKNEDGYKVTTQFPVPSLDFLGKDKGIGDKRDKRAMLTLKTTKYSGGYASHASLAFFGDGFSTFVMFQDFNKFYGDSNYRGTAKAVKEAHQRLLDLTPTILTDLFAHYAKDHDLSGIDLFI